MIFVYCHHLRGEYISDAGKMSSFLGNFRQIILIAVFAMYS